MFVLRCLAFLGLLCGLDQALLLCLASLTPSEKLDGLPTGLSARGLRFVVHRGTEGFGDRLQQLLMAVRYARATGRALVIDWRDAKFQRDALFDFGDFLNIRDVRVFHIQEFLYIWKALKDHLRVIPPMFRYHLENKGDGHWNNLKFPDDNRRMQELAVGNGEDFVEEVVVFAGDQYRYFHYDEIQYVRLQRWMADKVRRFMLKEGLKKGEYVVVHLRGGDKPWKCEEALTWFYQPGKERFQDSASKWPTMSNYLAYMRQETQRLNPRNLREVVLTDTPCLKSKWYEELCSLQGEQCEVNVSQQLLRKHQRRLIETSLLDFSLMSLADRVVADGHSLFALMAENCRATGLMDLLGVHDTDGPFQGWDPDEWSDL